MKPEYILLISAGGVFLLLVLIYMLYAIETSKSAKRNKQNIYKSYLPENLCKMEYDVSFYDKNVFIFNNRENARQVTIDDLLNEESDDMTKMSEDSVFAQVEEGGIEEIKGNFNPAE